MMKGALVYDVCSVPDGAIIDDIVRVWKEHEFILYDSHNGDAPVIYDSENIKGVLIDVSTVEEEKLKQIQKLLKS